MNATKTLGAYAILIFVAALAEGQPPVNEGVCDELMGSTPGLYGLCVAFCEAQDCELDFDLEDPFENCTPSSPKLLDIYSKKRQPGDPDMPCLQQPCPCWTQEELDGLRFPRVVDDVQCILDGNAPPSFVNVDLWQVVNSGELFNTLVYTAEVIFGEGPPRCRLLDVCQDGDCLQVRRQFSVGPGQLAACEEQLRQAGAERGFECFLE